MRCPVCDLECKTSQGLRLHNWYVHERNRRRKLTEEEERNRMESIVSAYQVDEVRKKVSIATKLGMSRIDLTERNRKISQSRTGIKQPMSPEGRMGHMGKRYSLETRMKLSQIRKGKPGTMLGRKHSEESKTKISLAQMGKIHLPLSQESRRRMSEIAKSRAGTPERREFLREIGRIGAVAGWGLEARQKHRESTLKLWQNPEFVSKIMRARHAMPNKAELRLWSILDEYFPGEWIYVGDGRNIETIVGGKCPDFWNTGHIFIELFGDYWHNGEDPQNRINHFQNYGYHTLIIWEHELNNITNILDRIEGLK